MVTTRIIECDQRVRTEQASVNAVVGPSKTKKKGKKPFVKGKAKDGNGKPLSPCFHCRETGHWNKDCPKKKKKPGQPGASSLLHVVENQESTSSDTEYTSLLCYLPSCEDWLMDSSATEHLTPHKSDFKSYEAYPESKATYVTLGDSKTQLHVHGSGTVKRWAEDPNSNKPYCRLTLTGVLHVPGITRCFLSISTFNNKGFELHIRNHRITLTKGNAALVGTRVGKLYVAPMWPTLPVQSPNKLYSVTSTPLPAKVWHECMGHLNWEALKTVKASRDLTPLKGIVLADEPLPHSSTCPGCQASKAKHRAYQPSTTRSARSTHPLECVHSDLVGLIPTASINGHWFTVSFTCDYSNHVWCLPMKSKDQTFATFKVFAAQVKRQYSFTIRYFQSDRSGEFMSKEFSDYLASEGIIREASAPDTPQQNGLAERMQQTIWSGIRAILHHSDMKNGFWAEALAVIVHVMNRAPRKRLDWRTPHEVLTGQVPNVAYFRTFGCHAWVHNHKGKKLDAKALPMVFIGYEPSSKAYRLWDSANHKVVISSDVTFNETLFPNQPVEKPVIPPTTDKGLNVPNVRSEGK